MCLGFGSISIRKLGMNWLWFALLAPAIYAAVVFVDKYILIKEVKDYQAMPIYSAIIATVTGSIIWILTGFPLLSFQDTLIILLTGILTISAAAFYFRALSEGEVSKITILFQLTPLITLALAYVFLRESITINQLLGFILILIVTIGVALNKGQENFKPSSTFGLILISDLFWALALVLFKFVNETNSFAKIVSFEGWGIGLGGIILYYFFPSVKNAFLKTNKRIKKRVLGIVFINESFYLLGRLLTYFAISLGPVALVSVVGGTQVFFAILYGWILTIFAPKIFKEDVSKRSLSKKMVMAALVLLGLWLVQN